MPRARELGLIVGRGKPGPLNAITDVAGVKVGHSTLVRGDNVRTGVTAIVPHGGNLFREKVPGAVFVGNAFGKLIGALQVNELGEIETPILLTGTLNVWRVADELVSYMLALPGNEKIGSINPVVGETNDGGLNDIRSRPLGHDHVMGALQSAASGPVAEGAVGAGTGTICFGFKGGIGTASRVVGSHTLGVLVQTNYGGRLTISGVPVAELLRAPQAEADADGSIMIVVATDAPIDHRNLQRIGARTMMGIGRTGSTGSNGSGDFAVVFSTARTQLTLIQNEPMSAFFEAAIEATEEAVYNSLFMAKTTTSNGRTIEALPVEKTVAILREHKAIR
jgi:D-aminopeptidase